jgi:hypothetical protein
MFKLQLKRKTILSIIALALCCFVLGSLFVYASTPSTTMTISSGPYPEAVAAYTITPISGVYYAKDQNGAIEYSGASALTVTQAAVTATAGQGGGLVQIVGFRLPSGVAIPSTVHVNEYYQGQIRDYTNYGMDLRTTLVVRADQFGVYYFETQNNTYTLYLANGAPDNTYASAWTGVQTFRFGNYTWTGYFEQSTASDAGHIFGFEWHHGRAGDGIIAFWWNTTHYIARTSYTTNRATSDAGLSNSKTVLAAQNWTGTGGNKTFSVGWSATDVSYYIDGALVANHQSNVPQYPMAFFIESYTITSISEWIYLNIGNFRDTTP